MAPRSRPKPRRRRARRAFPTWLIWTIVAAGLVVVLVVIGGVGWVVTKGLQLVAAQPPEVGTTIIAPEESKAAQNLEDLEEGTDAYEATAYLAAQPTAYWLTPEEDPIGDAGARVLNLAAEARDAGAALAVVIYGLPGRDCGQHSAGGLSEADYETWVGEIGEALSGADDVQKIVILEPDSLALAPDCGNIDERVVQLRTAIDQIAGINTWIYLDGGHSNWLPATEMASLISQVGANDKIRGFATNVSNYQPVYNEFAYAREVAAAIGGDMHAIVDTSRDGADEVTSEWCNPPDQLVGAAGGTYGDDIVDTNLWIKPPGESDGECNGGPAAGVWWPEAAVTLTSGLLP